MPPGLEAVPPFCPRCFFPGFPLSAMSLLLEPVMCVNCKKDVWKLSAPRLANILVKLVLLRQLYLQEVAISLSDLLPGEAVPDVRIVNFSLPDLVPEEVFVVHFSLPDLRDVLEDSMLLSRKLDLWTGIWSSEGNL